MRWIAWLSWRPSDRLPPFGTILTVQAAGSRFSSLGRTWAPLPCSKPIKLDRFWLEVSDLIPRLGGTEDHEGLEVSDAHKAFILKQGADGVPVADICRKVGISQATYFNWKNKVGRPAAG
jgi:transposase